MNLYTDYFCAFKRRKKKKDISFLKFSLICPLTYMYVYIVKLRMEDLHRQKDYIMANLMNYFKESIQ